MTTYNGWTESPEKIADRMKRLNELHEKRMAEKKVAETITVEQPNLAVALQ
jgi:hypothetical protein